MPTSRPSGGTSTSSPNPSRRRDDRRASPRSPARDQRGGAQRRRRRRGVRRTRPASAVPGRSPTPRYARSSVRRCSAPGRTLVRVGDDRWISGYDDTIADRLAEEGTGVLAPVDAAVLTLVLLHAVAIPAARGAVDSDRLVERRPSSARRQRPSCVESRSPPQRTRRPGIAASTPRRRDPPHRPALEAPPGPTVPHGSPRSAAA